MKTFWKKIKLFFREVGNILTNFLCPLVAVLVAGMEIFHLPIAWINFMKKVEYWCWQAYGTKDTIEEILNTIDEKLNK